MPASSTTTFIGHVAFKSLRPMPFRLFKPSFFLAFLLAAIHFRAFAQIESEKDSTWFYLPDSLFIPQSPVSLSELASDSLIVYDIVLIGNKKTKDRIILRELAFKVGDKVPKSNLSYFLEFERNKIFNTNLFVTTEIQFYLLDEEYVVIEINVVERWYTLVVPLIDFADRNFNEWWQLRNRDLSRLDYGLKFTRRNFRGRKEFLKVDILAGFTNNLKFEYDIPFIDKKQTLGLALQANYATNQDVAFESNNNQLNFFSSDRILISRIGYKIGISKRSLFYNSHRFELSFKNYTIDDSVAILNPDYFLNGRTRQRFFEINYAFTRDLRDVSAYPLKGNHTQILAAQRGIGIFNDLNLFILQGSYAHFFDLGKNFYLASSLTGKVSLPRNQPYNQLQGLGYGQTFVRGLDLYVIEGQEFVLSKNTLRYKVFSGQKSLGFIPIRQFATIPVAVYLKGFGDMGYVNNTRVTEVNRRLTNVPIGGAGLGLDVVTFYDAVLRFELSYNSINERNFFIYYTASF